MHSLLHDDWILSSVPWLSGFRELSMSTFKGIHPHFQ